MTRDLLLEESQELTNHFQHVSNSLGITGIFISSLENDENISERLRSLPKRLHNQQELKIGFQVNFN